MRTTRTRRSRSDWQTLVLAWHKTRQPPAHFARRHHLKPRELRWWAWKFEQPTPEVTAAANDLRFVEVPAAPPAQVERLVEVIFADRRTLRFLPDIEPRQHAQILAVIVSRQPTIMLDHNARIFVATAPIDFRGSFARLAGAVPSAVESEVPNDHPGVLPSRET